jgi:hypothetical protein
MSFDSINLQDYSIVGMYQEIDDKYKAKFLKDTIAHKIQFRYTVNNTELEEPKRFFSNHSDERILIINEDHARMESRAFFLSILPTLRTNGYTHLAMEAFIDTTQHLPSYLLGYYFQEPIMAEIYREALRLGFLLIPYEAVDQNGIYSNIQDRDSIQAYNLYKAVKDLKRNEKVVVFSGQSHLVEDCPMCPPLLGTVFKSISGIDPLTIDQTRGIANNYFGDFYFNRSTVPQGGLFSSAQLRTKLGFGFVDMFYIHQNYKTSGPRPDWLDCGGLRKKVFHKCKNKNAVLVQAYYQSEITSDAKLAYVTPADMTYQVDNKNNVLFYLVPGHEYVIVYRNTDNEILATETIRL